MATVTITQPNATASAAVTTGGTTLPTGSVTVPSSYFTAAGLGGSSITSNGNLTGAGLHVSNDAKFEGNIEWKGRDLGKLLETIEKRLAILVPNPEKLEQFEALKKAYNHYKTLEALCDLPIDKKE